ncbi:hypothetical protein CVT26_004110 [Gymnopilus dilepis]|uniref:Secreted protein n=1 Tax=Gymnopilus dilepis TaxID=231916 RepID=A0A409YVC3_9AGAR|nr:hypothetical protein CVT26_004110 [Gymnopilus dilepis]
MYSLRTICTAAAVLLASVVVNAAPLPFPGVPTHHVRPGSVFMAKPMHFDPPLPEHLTNSGARNHPVVALDQPDRQGYVPVAVVSHQHGNHVTYVHHDDMHHVSSDSVLPHHLSHQEISNLHRTLGGRQG